MRAVVFVDGVALPRARERRRTFSRGATSPRRPGGASCRRQRVRLDAEVARAEASARVGDIDRDGGPLFLYNTMSGQKEEFNSVKPDNSVSFYSCGPTVYDSAHIGNFRAFLTYDVVKRWLLCRGFAVTHVTNLTDVDDKIIKRVRRENTTLEQLTQKYTESFFEDLEALNVLPADMYPLATAHVEEMADMISGLLKREHAYERDGSVYFKVSSFPSYGRLVRLDRRSANAGESDEHMSASDADEYDKDDARDFAMWKAYKEEDGDVKWHTPFGVGRPGWHIECSCMAMKYLGEEIDLHGGGIDLVFPHHENEIAQAEAFSGRTFVRFWVHNGFVNVGGEKMSKSLNNFRTLEDVAKTPADARAFRYFVVSSHYRTTLNFTSEALNAARKTVKRLDALKERLADARKAHSRQQNGTVPVELQSTLEKVHRDFVQAMNDDLSTPRAAAALFELVKAAEKFFKQGGVSAQSAELIQSCLDGFDRVFGVFYSVPERSRYAGKDDERTRENVPEELLRLVEERTSARKARDFAKADSIRDQILAAGYNVKDTPGGAKLVPVSL